MPSIIKSNPQLFRNSKNKKSKPKFKSNYPQKIISLDGT